MRTWTLRAAMLVLVLALGVVLGAGPLQHSGTQRDRDLSAQRKLVDKRDQQVKRLAASNRYADSYADATAATLVQARLTGRGIALITLPGAEPAAAELRTLITAAGGKVVAEVELAPLLERSSTRPLVEALTSQMITQTPGTGVPATATGYQRFGGLLARAIGVPVAAKLLTAPYDPTAVSILSGFGTAALTTKPVVTARAALTLVLAGPKPESSAASEPIRTVLAAYAAQVPTVVAGPAKAARPTGMLAEIRQDDALARLVSTVDSLELTSGRVGAILALSARARGVVGSYGAAGSAALAPLG